MSFNMTNAGAGSDAVRLQNLKSTIERGRTEVARAEATLESLEKQEADINTRLLSEFNVKPEDLDAEIARLKADVAEKLGKAEALLAAPQGA